MAFRITQSNRIEALADRLAERLARQRSARDVARLLEGDLVVVPNHGLGLWLRQHIAERDGVAAGLEMPLPGSFVWQVLRHVDGELPRESPYRKAALAWRAWRWLADQPPERFRDYLAVAGERGAERRFDLAWQIGDVFDRYLVYRPDLLAAWERGAASDGDAAWQAALWRHLVAAIDVPSPAARVADLTRRIRSDARLVAGLPPVAVFGIASLPPPTLALLAALGTAIDVELFVLSPCRQYWSDIVAPRVAARARVIDADDAGYYTTGNPLLGSMGHPGRDFGDLAIELTSGHPAGELGEAFEAPPGETLLALTQREMLDLTVRGAPAGLDSSVLASNAGKFEVARDDVSIVVHVCASLLREVEVLHDQLLARFAADPTLEPRDVVVLTPDVVALAPIVEAVFGNRSGRRFIPYAISDRVPRIETAVADVFKALLALPDSRLTRSAVLSLLSAPVVAAKLGLGSDDLALIGHWVEEAGVYWGRDAAHVRQFGVEPDEPPAGGRGTWATGVDRILAGYAMAPDQVFDVGGAGIVPLAGVEGQAAAVAGVLAEFVGELGRVAEILARPARPSDWRRRLETLLGRFFAADGESAMAVKLLGDAVAEFEQELAAADIDEEIPLAVVQRWFDGHLGSVFTGQGFPSGAVTFATLTPMRAVPFRVVALVGMNDADFPRIERPIAFDLMAEERRKGDPSRRREDRYLFIEALLSARDALHLSYTGMAQRDATAMLPSVVISELLDYLGAAFCLAGDAGLPAVEATERLVAHVVTEHPLQPFSARYGRDAGLFTYEDYRADDGPPVKAAVAPRPFAAEVRIGDLLRFLAEPARAWFEAALATQLRIDAEHWQDDEPFALDSLADWQLRRDAFESLARMDGESWRARAELAGRLPSGARGHELLREAEARMRRMRERVASLAGGEMGTVPIELRIGGRLLVGSVPDVGPKGRVAARVGQAKAPDLARAWVMHLVLAAAGHPLDSWVVDEGDGWRLAAVDPTDARRYLAEVIEHAAMNAEHPLPLLCATGMQRVGLTKKLQDALEADFRDEHTRRVWGEPHVPDGLDELAGRLYAPALEYRVRA